MCHGKGWHQQRGAKQGAIKRPVCLPEKMGKWALQAGRFIRPTFVSGRLSGPPLGPRTHPLAPHTDLPHVIRCEVPPPTLRGVLRGAFEARQTPLQPATSLAAVWHVQYAPEGSGLLVGDGAGALDVWRPDPTAPPPLLAKAARLRRGPLPVVSAGPRRDTACSGHDESEYPQASI